MSGGRPRVLIVDDEADLAFPLRLLLEAEGCEPLLAADGEAALRVVDSESPDVVVLDLRMPVLDGWMVLAQLGGRAERPRVVVCSALTRVADQQRAFELGADAFVPKPFEPEYLVRTLREVLAREGAPSGEPR